jgi:hypothetical protein
MEDERREVDSRERNVASQTRRRSSVETDETELLDDVNSTLSDGVRMRLGGLTLHLEADFDNFERVGEDLREEEESIRRAGAGRRKRRTTWQPPAIPPAASSHGTLIRPVFESVAYSRTRSLTVSLMAFSGATPCRFE